MIESLQQLFWLALLIPAAIYLGAPLMIRAKQKMQAHPRIEPLDFEQLGLSISQFLMDQTKELFAIGFDDPTLLQLPQPVTKVSSYLVMLVKRDTGDKAMVTAVVGHGPATIKSCGIEFSTRFDNGEVFDTHNFQAPMAFPPSPGFTRTQVPILKDCRELFALHNYVMSKHGPKGRKILYEPGKALEYLIEFAFVKTYERQAQRGWLYYDPLEDVYRFTLKGAYLATWGLLPPIKALRLAALHRRASRILREFRQACCPHDIAN